MNNNSVFVNKVYTDSHVRTLNPSNFINYSGQFLQFERRCYVRIDKVTLEGNDIQYELFFVPDGKKVGLAVNKTAIQKQGDIKTKDLATKVEEKKNK